MKGFRAGLTFFLGISLLAPVAARQDPAGAGDRLTLEKIEQLLSVRAPDEVIATEIQDRGIVFSVSPSLLDRLRRRGAGPKTLRALQALVAVAALDVNTTPPECEVWVDGTLRGRTDEQGRLRLSGLRPGSHEVVFKKDGYRAATAKVELAPNSQERVTAALQWGGGFLTVLTGATGVAIEIERMGNFSDQVTELPCLPGTYQIRVSSPKYQGATKTVEVVAGQGATVSFSLEPDPRFVRDAVANLQNSFDSRSYASVINGAQELLSVDRKNKDALRLLAQSYFETARYGEAATIFEKALELGSTVSAHVCRQHFMSCDQGSFRMSTKEVSFVRPNGQKVFSATPSEVTTQGAQLFTLKQAAYVEVRVSGKKYSLFYMPEEITCNVGPVPECPEPGFTQQKVFANYVHRAIQKMAAGEFAEKERPLTPERPPSADLATPIGASQPPRPQPSSGEPSPPQPSAPTAASCIDYNSCITSGSQALRSSQWNDALAALQKAASLDSSKPDAWGLLGATYLSIGREQEAQAMWDKALQAGGVSFPACRERMLSCDSGSLHLTVGEVSFEAKGQKIFGAPPSQVESLGPLRHTGSSAPYLRLRVAGKNYRLGFLPFGIECKRHDYFLECPEAGVQQQLTISKYVSEKIPTLALRGLR